MKKNNISRLLRFIICLLLIGALILFAAGAGGVPVQNLIKIKINLTVVVRLAVMILAVVAAESLLVFLLRLIKPKNHRARSVISVVCSVLKYVAALTALCWGLAILGVDFAAIAAGVGIIALVVGFSAESLIADIVTGAFIIFENQYNVGDVLEVDGFRGTVMDIGIRTTSLSDVAGNIKVVNNSDMTNILNRSENLSVSVSDIRIGYDADLEALEAALPALLEEIHSKHLDIMKATPIYLGVQEFGDSALILRFIVDVSEENIYHGMRVLNHDLYLGFKKLGVEVPVIE